MIETHPGGGMYDCLQVLLDAQGDHDRPAIVLNRAGSVHVLGGETAADARWETFWTDRARFVRQCGRGCRHHLLRSGLTAAAFLAVLFGAILLRPRRARGSTAFPSTTPAAPPDRPPTGQGPPVSYAVEPPGRTASPRS
ncbi:MAG: TY-Chap2 family putative peptide chaperone [Thermoleophilia bacterium]